MMSPKIWTILLLLLGLTLPALSQNCPDSDRLPTTCECEDDWVEDEVDIELSCSGSTLRELRDALELIDREDRLEVQLDDMKIGDLPEDIFNGLNVVRLDISHCEMDALAPSGVAPLQGLEETLEELVIIGSFTEENGLTNLPSLAHLRRLREIDISYNAITELNDNWFSSPPPVLKRLIFTNNGIERIGDRAFENLVNLEVLELDGNRFGPIKRSMLPRAGNRLKNLELDNNGFTSLPEDIFTDFPALTDITIRTNGIVHLQEKTFKPIWSQLDVFDARGNPLECDSSMEWLFNVENELTMILGTCQGPPGREGLDLDDFIESKGQ